MLGAAALLAGGMGVMPSARPPATAAQEPSPNTVKVKQGKLSAMVSLNGLLTHRARPDGSPYAVINQTRGIYTALPQTGDQIACGDVFYRVNDHPVLLLCGPVPVYRALHSGDVGQDVRQLNRNLHTLGHDVGAAITPDDNTFTVRTRKALEKLQQGEGANVTGKLELGDAVFLPESVQIARVTGELGGSAQPGEQVLSATSGTQEVQVNLDAAQQGEVKKGDLARITLPGNASVTGRVDRLGRVAQVPAGQSDAGAATLQAYIRLDDPTKAGGLDQAPVQVDVTAEGVENALSVPVVALVGTPGGGFAVEIVRAGSRRELVAVKLGLFDTSAGRVQVDGKLHEGDEVVVPPL